MTNFTSFGLSPNILRAIEELNFITPTPIQEQVIPILLEQQQDIVGLAQTGTGKTAAFGLPLLNNINTDSKETQVLIISPTRELCMQISNDLLKYSKYINNINIVAVYGGSSIENQVKQIKRGCQIIVSTPGRIYDLLKRKKANISNIHTLILDEADEMLNMGFRDDLESILSFAPKERQTLLFSATMPSEVSIISKKYLSNPLEISVGQKNSGAVNVEHQYMAINEKDRYAALRRVIDFYPGMYSIVFCRTRNECQTVATKLMNEGYNADTLHGDLSQAQRDYAMNRFRSRGIRILVATDVAARGLDVTELSHVINYNLPEDIDIYIHRSGRTGRANNEGISISFINSKEKFKIKALEKKLNRKFIENKIPTGNEICEQRLLYTIEEMLETNINDELISNYILAFEEKLENLSKDDILKRFLSIQFNHFYQQYQNAPDLNPNLDKETFASNSGFTRMFINIGKFDEIDKPMLREYIIEVVENNIDISNIDMRDKFSIFTIPNQFVDIVNNKFSRISFEGRKLRVNQMDRDNSRSSRSEYNRSSNNRDRDRGRDRNNDRNRDRSRDRNSNKDNRNNSYKSDNFDNRQSKNKKYDNSKQNSSENSEPKKYRSDNRSFSRNRTEKGGRGR